MYNDFSSLLESLGCDSSELTMSRFGDDKSFYLDILSMTLSDPGFESLGEKLSDDNLKPAYDTAHALKGIISNCGITDMYNTIDKLVVNLRNGAHDSLLNDYKVLLSQRTEILSKLKAL